MAATPVNKHIAVEPPETWQDRFRDAVAPRSLAMGLGVLLLQLGFILSKTVSGDIQVALGYERFFLWTIACGVPAFVLLWFVRLPDSTANQPVPAQADPA